MTQENVEIRIGIRIDDGKKNTSRDRKEIRFPGTLTHGNGDYFNFCLSALHF